MEASTYDTYLINGTITVFFGAHGEDYKQDILNSSLLGDLASTSKHSNNREQLFSEYANTVGKLGWIENARTIKQFEFSNKSLLEIVELGMGTSLTKEEKQFLLNAFLQLKKPPTQSPIIQKILDKLQANTFIPVNEINCVLSTQKPVATSTRLTVVRNNASIITLQVKFKTCGGISMDILDQPLLNSLKDGKSNMWLLNSSLDARQYDKIRASVIKKIGNHINTDLLHVPTPNRLG
ncbi:hypothetical protein IMF27_12400 [Pseudomonas sp. PCH199]|uniref:hypothetical protein n=1 Tax=unclassified Pseudomonas TaxID=196821 RepID=UPI000BCE2464|nr:MULTISPECIES: hypothetical protein [unclassified Pseudomonas]MCW8276381.1 hypothetical protein [Pseudomonas sp. PCH199]PAM83178.1 hypothetical protein CES87_12685 [Pseudomonas sp. ERMR1:02]